MAPPEVRVRPMQAADIQAVRRVEQAAGALFRGHPDLRIAARADDPPMPAEDLAELAARARAWVAVVAEEVVGFIAVRELDGCGHVEEVSVDPAHGGRGHGTALLDRAAEWAREQGFAAVTLTTFRDVAWNRPFYERRGFVVVGDDELSPALHDLLDEEEAAQGLVRSLRVVMRRDVPAS